MKAKIKATGEIINIASYARITLNMCDSYGTPIEVKPEEIELIEDMIEEDKHWQDVRERAAIAAMQGLLANNGVYLEGGDTFPKLAVSYADTLIEELKKK